MLRHDRALELPWQYLSTVFGISLANCARGRKLRLQPGKSADSLYIELRSVPAKRTREIEQDVMLDLGEDGEPVGYDLQYASAKRDLILSIILGDELKAAAE